MNNDSTTSSLSPSVPKSPAESIPWGQLTWLFFGTGLCLNGLRDVFRLGASTAGEFLAGISGIVFLLGLLCGLTALIFRERLKRRSLKLSRVPALRRVNTGILGTAVVLLLVALLVPAVNSAQTATQQAALESSGLEDTTWKTLPIGDGSFVLSLPSHWEPYPDPTLPGGNLSLWDRQNDLYLTVTTVAREDVTWKSLKELSDQTARSIGEQLMDAEIGALQPGTVDGCPTANRTVSGTLNGVRLVYALRHIESPDTWIEVRSWATRSRFQQNHPLFWQIASSVQRQK